MIANLREQQFMLRAHAAGSPVDPSAVLVRDQSRVVAAGRRAVEEGYFPGRLLEPPFRFSGEVKEVPFSLNRAVQRQERILRRLRNHVMVLEVLDFGEVQVEIEDPSRVQAFLEQEESFRAAVAPTGWLARVLNTRPVDAAFQFVSHNRAQEVMESVPRREFWGMGDRLMERMKELEIDRLKELNDWTERDRRNRFGGDVRVLERLLENRDPRPLNAFSRPKKLVREIDWPVEPPPRQSLQSPVSGLIRQLRNSCSLAHRVEINLRDDGEVVHTARRDSGLPFREKEVLMSNLLHLINSLPDLPGTEATIGLAGIVADLDRYHQKTLEDETSLEVL